MLKGKKGLVIGIGNDQSIAWACARAMHEAGATLGGTWLNDKARPHVEPLLQSVNAEIQLPLDVRDDAQLQALFEAVAQRWGRLDFLLHSIAFAPKDDLHGRVTDSSREGFLLAMDISCHSFMRMARLAEPLMSEGGSLMTMSYHAYPDLLLRDTRVFRQGPLEAAGQAPLMRPSQAFRRI